MNISVWLAVPGTLLACGALVVKGGKAWAWLRKRMRRSEPQAWVIEPDDARDWQNLG